MSNIGLTRNDEELGEEETLDKLFKDLRLAENKILNANSNIRDQLYELIREYKEVFV